MTVTAYNSSGTIATGYIGTVHFSSTDGQAVLPANYTFTSSDAGTHTFTVTLKTAGTQSITATDTTLSTITGAESAITVQPATAQSLQISGLPATLAANAQTNIKVTAYDAYGNVASGYAGTVHFTTSDSQAILPANYTFTTSDSGAHTFSVMFSTPGTQSLTATDTATASITGTGTISITSASLLFHDTFSGSAPSSAWSFIGGAWQVNNGTLSQTSTTAADPKKALITNPTYPRNVMLTAEVEVNSWTAGDMARAGVGLDTSSSTGNGYNLVFHGTDQVAFLDDHVAWGNAYTFNWQVGTWYWFQLEENNGTLEGKVWAAGTAEPQTWMFQQTGWTTLTGGAPALNGSSASATGGSATVSFASVSVTTTSVQPDTASAGSAITSSAGSALSFSQATATGTGPLTYAWNFGDGTTTTGTLNPSHTYQNPGTYTAQLTVTDALGIPATSTLVVTVNDVAPTVSLTAPTSGTTGTALSFTAVASDISPADQAAGFTYSWSFGDGGTATGATPSHAFATAGTYTVTVTATDKYGLSGTASDSISIANASSLFCSTILSAGAPPARPGR